MNASNQITDIRHGDNPIYIDVVADKNYVDHNAKKRYYLMMVYTMQIIYSQGTQYYERGKLFGTNWVIFWYYVDFIKVGF